MQMASQKAFLPLLRNDDRNLPSLQSIRPTMTNDESEALCGQLGMKSQTPWKHTGIKYIWNLAWSAVTHYAGFCILKMEFTRREMSWHVLPILTQFLGIQPAVSLPMHNGLQCCYVQCLQPAVCRKCIFHVAFIKWWHKAALKTQTPSKLTEICVNWV